MSVIYKIGSMLRSRPVRYMVLGALCLMMLRISGCAGTPNIPDNPHNICDIFRENREWYWEAYESYRNWGIPISVLMAIMYHESGFRAKARPRRTTCLFIFPGTRPSSAYGYAQAIDSTWENYKQFTGNEGADRDDFADAVDFMGWYCRVSHKKCHIARHDAYHLYLAYHEGQMGFLRKTYEEKQWLKNVAADVSKKARIYSSQLASCEWEFREEDGGCCLLPF